MNDERETLILGKMFLYKLELELVIFLQKLAVKAAEKGVEKIGEKIYDKFSTKKAQPPETKGKEIMAILKQENIPNNDLL